MRGQAFCIWEGSHTDVVELLLGDSRVDPSARNNLAIGLAARNRHTEIFELVLQSYRPQ